jgi:folate-dependent phosphoribosylglycinamide formyltransferase PurN
MESITVITNGNYFSKIILEKVIERYHDSIISVMVINGDYFGRTGLRALWGLSRTTATPYILYKVYSLITLRLFQKRYPELLLSVNSLVNKHSIPVIEFASVKDKQAIEWVSNRKADLIISVSCPQMIGKNILNSARLGGINIHSSLLPANAGLAPYYWVLSKGENETGISVHYMTLKFDEGNILVQKRTDIEPGESAFSLFYRLATISREALVEGVNLAIEGDPGKPQDLSKYSYYSNPTFKSYLTLRRNGHVLIRSGEIRKVIAEEMGKARGQ